MKRALSTFMFVLLLVNTLAFSFNLQSVKASGTIFIRADGSTDPPDAPIATFDNVTYTFTGNIVDKIAVERDNIVVDGAGYTLQGSGSGGSEYRGIDLSGGSNVTIKNTNIRDFGCGIGLSSSSGNSISGNNITNSYYGIYLVSSSNSSVSGNNITANSGCGIRLDFSSSSSVSGNNITANYQGDIVLWSSSNNSIVGNNITANGWCGILLEWSSSNNSVSGNTFVNCGLVVSFSYGNVVTDNLVNGKPLVYLEEVSDHAVEDAGQVILVKCNNVTVENLNLSNTNIGVQLWETNNTTISRNNITNNGCGIALNEEGQGIGLSSSSNNTISENNITNNGRGISLSYASANCIIENNIARNGWGIGLWVCSNNRIIGNNITDTYCGWIPVWYGLSGIDFYGSWDNIVLENNIASGIRGIYLEGSPNNSLYHNNLVNNTDQVLSFYHSTNIWDNGYPSGGNYWSDYTGIDQKSGSYQNETGSDGMGDTPYAISADSQDNYPLMNPWPLGWRLDFAGPTNHPIVDFAVYNGSLYAVADNRLYVKEGSSWNVIDASTFVTSLEPYGDKLVVGGQGGLYCYDGTSFSLVFSVPTYIKVLGAYSNTLYAGTVLDNPPRLYYCNGSADNPSDWHIDTGFSGILNFSGPFGSIDSFWASNDTMGAPVAYWKFDEGSGTTAYDSSGNDNDGTICGASWVDGKFGKALSFDGVDDYVVVNSSSSLSPLLDGSVEFWFKLARNVTAGDDQAFCLISVPGTFWTTPGAWNILLDSRTLIGDDAGKLHAGIWDGSSWHWVKSAQTSWLSDCWYHALWTFGSKGQTLFINGVNVSAEGFTGQASFADQDDMLIGMDRGNLFQYFNGTIDEVKIYDYARTPEEIWSDYCMGTKMYVASGSTIYSYDVTGWNQVKTYDDVYAFLDMQAYNDKLYLATRDQGWRKPYYEGGTGFSGRVIEYDGENWTTVLDHDYWVYSLEVYDDKLYAGTANKILTYNGTDWETSFNATEGAYYAIAMINYEGKIYAGMGNGYIFADPAPPKANTDTATIPEFPSFLVIPLFIIVTLLAIIVSRRKRLKHQIVPQQ